VIGEELMKRTDPGKPFRDSSSREQLSGLVHQMNVVMILCPIVSDEQHRHRLPSWIGPRAKDSQAAD
jgi:hypothetical protein